MLPLAVLTGMCYFWKSSGSGFHPALKMLPTQDFFLSIWEHQGTLFQLP